MDTTNIFTPGVDAIAPTLTADAGLQGWPPADATVRTVSLNDDLQKLRLSADLSVGEDGQVDVAVPPHTRDRVVYFREATMDNTSAQLVWWKGKRYEMSDLLLAAKYGSLRDGTKLHPEEAREVVLHIADITDVSEHLLYWRVLNWSEMELYQLCGHRFEWTTRGVVIPGHPRWRKAARERRERAIKARDYNAPSVRLDVYSRSNSAPTMVPQSLTDTLGGAVSKAIKAAGKALGTGVAEGMQEQSGAIAASAVHGAAAAVEERVGSTITRVFEAIVSAFESVRSQVGRLLEATTKGLRVFVDFVVSGGQALVVWALSKISGIGSSIIRGVADMLGFDFSAVDVEEAELDGVAPGLSQQSGAYWSAIPGTVAKALLAAVMAAVVPKWGGPVSNWRPLVDITAKSVPFTVGVSSMVEWILETLQWFVNCLVKLCGGSEVKWFQSRSKEASLWLARSYDYMSSKEALEPEEFMLHYQMGADLAKTSVGSLAASPIHAMLQALQSKFVTAQNSLAYSRASRPEPVAVILEGAPGIGKSLMTASLHNIVTLSLYPRVREEFMARADTDNPLDLGAFMFDHTDAKHWNGYDPDRALTFRWDDVGKVRPGMESATKESETEMLMCIINTASFNLEYADVESKGKHYFRSPLVLMTTNLNKAQWEDRARFSLTTPDALMRRLQIFLTVTVNPEFSHIFPDGKLDVAEYNNLSYSDRDKVYKFSGTCKGGSVTFDSQEDLARFVARTMSTVKANFVASAVRARRDAVEALKNMSFDDEDAQPGEPEMVRQSGPEKEEGDIDPNILFLDELIYEAASIGDEYPTFKSMYQIWEQTHPDAAKKLQDMGVPVPQSMEEYVALALARGGYDPLRKPPTIHTCKSYTQLTVEWLLRTAIGGIAAVNTALKWLGKAVGLSPQSVARVLIVLPAVIPLLRSAFSMVKGFFFQPKKGLSPESTTMSEHVLSNTIRNMYAFGIRRPGGAEPFIRGKVFFIKGQYALMPYHFLTDLEEDKEALRNEGAVITLKSMSDGKWIDVEWSVFDPEGPFVVQLLGHDNRPIDLALVRIGGREHRDMTGVLRMSGSPKPLDLTMATVDDEKLTPFIIPDVPAVRYKDSIDYKQGTNIHVDKAVYYDVRTQAGFCGSMVVSQGDCGRSFIVGMHVAGDGKGVGAAACFTADQIRTAISTLSVKAVQVRSVVAVAQTQEGFCPPLDKQGTKLQQRAVARSVYPNGIPDKPNSPPSMVASAVLGWSAPVFDSRKKPAVCTEAAVEIELEKYSQDRCIAFDSEVGSAAFVAAECALNDQGMPAVFRGSRILSNVEAWTGMVNGVRVAEPINNRTSTGYPFQNLGHVKSKMVSELGVLNGDSPSLQLVFRCADDLLDDLLKGKEEALADVVFKVSPKRELRPPEKGPRVIQCAPLHVVLVWRRVFWEFMSHYSTWAPEKELGIGLDPRTHWDELADWLRSGGHEEGLVGAGDYSQFDQCQEPVISRAIGEAVIGRYGKNDRYNRVRRLLWRTACGPRIVFKNIIYQLEKGMPSGHPATSIINGLYNCTLFRLCYTSLKRGALVSPVGGSVHRLKEDMVEFKASVRLSVTGDDNIFASRNPAFNEMALPALMARFGARYTLDTKMGSAALPFRPLEAVSYLGRAFRREQALGYKWVAPLRLESIALMAQYAEKPNQLTLDWYISTHKCIVEELSFHTQVVWHTWMPVVNSWFYNINGFQGIVCPPTPYETEIDRMVVQLAAAPLVAEPVEVYE